MHNGSIEVSLTFLQLLRLSNKYTKLITGERLGRRSQHRISQVTQTLNQPAQPVQPQSPPSDQLLSWPIGAYSGWSGGSNPPSYAFASSEQPEATSVSRELQASSHAAYGTTTNVPVSENVVTGTDLGFTYSAAGSEFTAQSYSSGLPTSSPVLPYDNVDAFDMMMQYGSGFSNDTNTLSTAKLTINPPNNVHALDPRLTPCHTPPNQSTFRNLSTDEQLHAYTQQGSSKIQDPALRKAASNASSSADSTGTQRSNNETSSGDDSSSNSSMSIDNLNDSLPILHIASHRGRDAIVQILLERDVDINERDSSGRTALQLAATYGHAAVVRLLLQSGAQVNATDSLGRTALHWATLQKQEPVLRVFLEAGADVNVCDVNGWTALHVAVERGFEAGLKLLLLHGADLSLKARKCEVWKQSEPAA